MTDSTAQPRLFFKRSKSGDKSRIKKHSDAFYLLFLTPIFVILGFLDFYPIAYTIYISMTNMSLISFYTYKFIFLANYYKVFVYPSTLSVIIQNIVFAVGSIALMATIGFVVALLLSQKGLRGKTLFRTMILFPWAFPAFITILIWKNMLNPFGGAVSEVFVALFNYSPRWLSQPTLAMLSMILVNLWLSLAYYTFVYSASLQSIPEELYDAAEMDGYGTFGKLRNVVFPLLSRQIAFITIFGFIFTWSNFYIPFLLTGGQPGTSTQILITYSYTEAFSYHNYSIGAVYSIISILILLAMVIVANHYSKMMTILY